MYKPCTIRPQYCTALEKIYTVREIGRGESVQVFGDRGLNSRFSDLKFLFLGVIKVGNFHLTCMESEGIASSSRRFTLVTIGIETSMHSVLH